MSIESNKSRKIFDGRYEIVSIVGRGAASVVYHGRRATAPYADVAIKVLTDKGATLPAKERLRKEALAMLYARHRYVIRLDDFRSVGDLCYLSMEYAPHKDLRAYMTEHGTACTAAQRQRYFSQAAEALGYIHRAGLIHRDIKPDNILVMNEAEIRVADFGVAVLPSDEASLSELQRGVGTLDYLSPEVLDGVRCDQRSDVYGLGVTFYELLAGNHPFSQTPLAEQLNVRRDGAFTELNQATPDIPDYINSAIMRCLAFDPAARFENGQQLFEALLLGRDRSKRKGKNRSRAGLNKSSNSALDESNTDLAADPIAAMAGIGDATPLPTQLAVGELIGGADDFSTNPAEELLAERDVSRETVLIPKAEVAAARSGDTRSTPATIASPTEQMAGVSRDTATSFKSLSSLNQSNPLTESPRSIGESLGYASKDNQQDNQRRSANGSAETGFARLRDIMEQLKERLATALEAGTIKLEQLQEDPRTKIYLPIMAVVAATVLGVVIMASRGSAPVELPQSEFTKTTAQTPQRVTTLSFPRLAPGRYEGRVEGLIPGVTSPLAFIVPDGAKSVVTIIGIDGWTPVFGRYPGVTGPGSERLRVSSNGFLIDFTGQVDGEAIVGFFHDRSTGTQGRWETRIAR